MTPAAPSSMAATAARSAFDAVDLLKTLDALTDAQLDDLDFGVIGFNAEGQVHRYNRFESEAAGLSKERVLGNHLFTVVAPCMNNFLVAQRFEDALQSELALDETIGYVLTLRMRPIKVKLRLLAAHGATSRYVLVQRAI